MVRHQKCDAPEGDGLSGYTASRCPATFIELYQYADERDEFELGFREFLYEFFRYRTARFVAVPRPIG